MENQVKFKDRFVIDYDEKCILLNSGAFTNSRGVGADELMKIPFQDISCLGFKAPGFMSGSAVIFIINGKKLVNKSGLPVCICAAYEDKANELQPIIYDLKKALGVEIIDYKKGLKYPEETYKDKYKLVDYNEERAKAEKAEIRKRCNVCGHIFCYNQADINENRDNAKSAIWSGVGQIAGAVGGAYTASAVNHTNAQNSLNKIVDFNRCPQCNSTDLAIISDEEFEAMKAQNNAPQQATVSAADELKKFKELLDMGAITQEEFDTKKKELLGL